MVTQTEMLGWLTVRFADMIPNWGASIAGGEFLPICKIHSSPSTRSKSLGFFTKVPSGFQLPKWDRSVSPCTGYNHKSSWNMRKSQYHVHTMYPDPTGPEYCDSPLFQLDLWLYPVHGIYSKWPYTAYRTGNLSLVSFDVITNELSGALWICCFELMVTECYCLAGKQVFTDAKPLFHGACNGIQSVSHVHCTDGIQ